jgi:hypothetical protein
MCQGVRQYQALALGLANRTAQLAITSGQRTTQAKIPLGLEGPLAWLLGAYRLAVPFYLTPALCSRVLVV